MLLISKPKVNSSFIRLSPKSDLNISTSEKSKLFKVIDMAFVSRRKNIRNNLKGFNLDWSKNWCRANQKARRFMFKRISKYIEEFRILRWLIM